MGRKPILSNLRGHQVLDHWRKGVPLLREGSADFVNQYEPLSHHFLMRSFTCPLVPGGEGSSQELLRVAQRQELFSHGRRHLRTSIRSHNIRYPPRSHAASHHGSEEMSFFQPFEWFDLGRAQKGTMPTQGIAVSSRTACERSLTIHDHIGPRQLS